MDDTALPVLTGFLGVILGASVATFAAPFPSTSARTLHAVGGILGPLLGVALLWGYSYLAVAELAAIAVVNAACLYSRRGPDECWEAVLRESGDIR